MNDIDGAARPTWFVGASFGTDDQLPRFLAEGIWENGYTDRHLDLVRSMRPGDRIAIKASYTRKHELPFDNRGQAVSVMAIKAIGTVTENLDDGRHVRVSWTPVEPLREWYFFTNRGTIWRLTRGDWSADALIAFAFEGKSQDIDQFRNAPYWRERFGSTAPGERRFGWTKFYEAIATKLLDHRDDRSALVAAIRDIAGRSDGLGHLAADHFADGTTGFVRDICPFTTMGLFNRGLTNTNRKAIAKELAEFLGVEEAVPQAFDGIPVLNNLKSWYFPFEESRPTDQIDALWEVFAAGLAYADADTEDDDGDRRAAFATAFDNANGRPGVAWNLTFGLYWARPWDFLSLDNHSKAHITEKLSIPLGRHGPKKRSNAADYLAVMDNLERRFQEPSYPVHSYPELSLESWRPGDATDEGLGAVDDDEHVDTIGGSEGDNLFAKEAPPPPAPLVAYSVDDILRDGCFLERSEIDRFLGRLREKKNLILQGPPGTGKTWLAKRLAFALMGQRDENRVRAVQFHPNLSYEDFIRGWRPGADGRLSLVDGLFMDVVKAASKDPAPRVVVIEEINRGNPAQIFGELLTLLEAGKRTPSEALELSYPDADGKHRRVHVPGNLYVIGTMNIADRSLAMVDLALRRRFAFIDLEPKLGNAWREWVARERAVDPTLAADIEHRVGQLNALITGDTRLGKSFRIGHSYVTPTESLGPGRTSEWFRQVVETEIGPLLDEYWFDAPDEAKKARHGLLLGW